MGTENFIIIITKVWYKVEPEFRLRPSEKNFTSMYFCCELSYRTRNANKTFYWFKLSKELESYYYEG